MPDLYWLPPQWYLQSADEREPQDFPLDQGTEIDPEEEIERHPGSYHPVGADDASHLPTPEPLPSTQAAAVPVQTVQDDSDPAIPIELDYLVCSVNIAGIPGMLLRDCKDLAQRREAVAPPPGPTRAEQLLESTEFQEWFRRPDSSRLLVHGGIEPPADMFGLSQFCMSFAHALQKDSKRFVPLVFYCGLHTQPSSHNWPQPVWYNGSDQPSDSHPGLPRVTDAGGRAMFLSLIHQLLCKIHLFGCTAIDATWQELHNIQNGDPEALNTLFGRLVHAVPEGVAVCCLIDGVEYYERNGFWNDTEYVLKEICQLADKKDTRASFKVLFTTPTHTRDVKGWFPDERVLSMKWKDQGETMANANSAIEEKLASEVEKGGPYSNERRERLLDLGIESE